MTLGHNMQDDKNSSQELTLSQESLADVFPQDALRHLNFEIPSDIDLFSSGEERQNSMQINYESLSATVPFSPPSHDPIIYQAAQPVYQMPSEPILPPDAVIGSMTPIMSQICMPPKNSWSGDYGFDVHFGHAEKKNLKAAPWIYSAPNNKLYVLRNSPTPFDVITTRCIPDGCIIRAIAVYSQPSDAQVLVRRCPNHALRDMNSGMRHSEHLIRCECSFAHYEEAGSGQLSVIVPYVRPPVGESHSRYIFKFGCFGSCSGGPNRRPLMMIFTLERGGMVLGRRSVHIKICACPSRDSEQDEKRGKEAKTSNKENSPLPKKRKPNSESYTEHVANIFGFMDKLQDSGKKPKVESEEGPFTITVHERRLYKLLCHVIQLYQLHQTMANLPSSAVNFLKSVGKSRKDDSTDSSD